MKSPVNVLAGDFFIILFLMFFVFLILCLDFSKLLKCQLVKIILKLKHYEK